MAVWCRKKSIHSKNCRNTARFGWFSIHEEDIPAFRLLRLRARRMPGLIEDSREVLLRLFDGDVEYSADALEGAQDALEEVSAKVLKGDVSDEVASEVLATTRQLGVECKFIELLDAAHASPPLVDIPWAALGYQTTAPGLWQHRTCGHRAMARRCNTHQAHAPELFIGADGVRQQLQGQSLGTAQMFTLDMLAPQPQPRLETHADKHPKEQAMRFFQRTSRLATVI